MAEEYDCWFENNPLLYSIELQALLAIQENLPIPRLEIGVGPGRFAQDIDVGYGIDPAITPLQLATRRSIIVVNGIGESIPLLSASMGSVFMLFTWCFLTDALDVLQECSRILKRDGRLVIGMIPRLSEWGRMLSDKGEKGHPCYRHAKFRSIAETREMLSHREFRVIESWSTLFQTPGNSLVEETPRSGTHEDAGFCVLITSKEGDIQ